MTADRGCVQQSLVHRRGQVLIRRDFGDDQPLPDDPGNVAGIVERDAQDERQRIEDVAEEAAQRPAALRAEQGVQPIADARKHQVHQRDQPQHRDQQGDDSRDHANAGVGAVDDRLEEAAVPFVVGLDVQAQRLGRAALGQEDLGHDQRRRGGQERGGDQMPRNGGELPLQGQHVKRQHVRGDGRHAGGQDRAQFGSRQPGQVRLDRQVGFHADEDVAGGGERLGARDPHQPGEDPREGLDQPGHDPGVIQDGDQGGEEDDGRERLEGQDEAEGLDAVLVDLSRAECQPAEDEVESPRRPTRASSRRRR